MQHKKIALYRSVTKLALPSCLNDRVPGYIIAFCVASATAVDSAEPEPEKLPDTTIIANRIATPLSQVGSSVTVLDVDTLSQSGVRSVDEALKFVPGVTSESLGGQRGSSSDVYIRGLRTTHTHMLVDGMRISDTNSGFILSKQFLGSNNLNGLSRIEVLRGPQGALYGGDSIAGVLGLYSQKGYGDHSGSVQVEGGSFNSVNSTLSLQGSEQGLSYSMALGQELTDNDLPHNTFDMTSYALRLDYEVNNSLSVGLTLRGADSTYEGPQTGTFYNGPDETDFRYDLLTLFANYQWNDVWSSKLTLGIYDQESDFVSRAPTPSFGNPGDLFYNPGTQPPTVSFANEESLTKKGIYWDNTIKWSTQHTTIAGLVAENSDYYYRDSFGSDDERERKQQGAYINHIWSPCEPLSLSGGLRWEDYSDDGRNGFNDDVFTWRLAGAYSFNQSNTIFRASLGHGFRIPNSSELNGNPAFGIAANPDLDPVESLGWDLGIEQGFCDNKYTLGLTYFGNRLEDAITNSGSGYVNIEGTSETSGIEASATANFLDERLSMIISYTWLDRSLVDIPDNTIGLRINGKVSDKLQAGISASYMDSRSYGGNSLSSYHIINLYGNYALNDHVALNLRVENLLDESYDYYSDTFTTYPGRGRGVFGGVTIAW